MAFKAMNYFVAKELDLEPPELMNAFQSACFVFTIQALLISLIMGEMFMSNRSFAIIVPSTLECLIARFVSTTLMHLIVESDIRQGLVIMKYVTNHPFDFISPAMAFCVGFMQFMGGLGAEIVCILYLGSFDNPFHVLLRFIALASIARVDNIYIEKLS